jgi:hypothetical protein
MVESLRGVQQFVDVEIEVLARRLHRMVGGFHSHILV